MILLSKSTVRRHFNRAAKTYSQASLLRKEVLMRLLSRFDFIKMNPMTKKTILDYGVRCGESTKLLCERFPASQIVAYDCSEKMLNQVPISQNILKICADYENLPLNDHQFDIVFSNLTLHWVNHFPKVIQELYRVLKPQGLLLFTVMGPDTLKELRTCFARYSCEKHVHSFLDMHDIGDVLIKSHFEGPVMDMEYLQIRYHSVLSLIDDLKKTGATNADLGQAKGLMGKGRWHEVLSEYTRLSATDDFVSATMEIIYGHAWGSGVQSNSTPGEIKVPLSILKRSI